MNQNEQKMMELTRTICELHRYDQFDASAAIQQLKNRGLKISP
jgi:hypothetical protein